MTSFDQVKIRQAEPGDLDPLYDFIEPFVDVGRLLPRTLEELESLLPGFFVADMNGRIIGCAALEIYSKKLAEVRSLAVSPLYRHQGIGRRLVDACVHIAQEKKILEVMAITSTEEFFLACGFNFTLPGEKKALFLQTRESP